MRTDASDGGIGAVLMQEHDGKVFPVCYGSKKLSSAEKSYSTIEKECLAVVWESEGSTSIAWSFLCITNRSRATEVHEECEFC